MIYFAHAQPKRKQPPWCALHAAMIIRYWRFGLLSIYLILALCYLGQAGSSAHQAAGASGQWSQSANDLCAGGQGDIPEENRNLAIPAPDRTAVVHVVKDHWYVTLGQKRGSLRDKQSSVGCPAELGWSPDSRAFYITQSDGSIAGFQTLIYQIEGTQLRRLPDVNLVLRRNFNHKFGCVFYDNGRRKLEEHNVAGLKWIDKSNQLLIVMEVLPDSWCRHRGYFGGYLVSLPSAQIIQRFSPNDLMKQWANVLGERLKGDLADLSPKEQAVKP